VFGKRWTNRRYYGDLEKAFDKSPLNTNNNNNNTNIYKMHNVNIKS